MTVGKRIKEARKQAGLKQSELAEQLGVAVVTIGQYERDKRQPTLAQLRNIAGALNADIVYLISGQTSAEVEQGILFQKEAEAKYYAKSRFAEAEAWKDRLNEIGQDLRKLNDEGQVEAVKRVKELTEIKKYQHPHEPSPLSAGIKVYGDGPAGSFLPAPQAPAEPKEGTDTTPPSKGSERPPEGK